MIDTLRLTAEEASALLDRGEVSPAELHRAYAAAAGERNAELHAYLRLVDFDGGTGVPIALKDVISTKGVETTAGSKILAGYTPVFDSTVAARCRAAGLPLLGKTNTDEFAMGSSTENSAYGPSHNPWDPRRVPAAPAAARPQPSPRLAPGVSAPTPAARSSSRPRSAETSACGRPTARVSRYGIVAFASSLDQVGPVAKTVRERARCTRSSPAATRTTRPRVALPEAVELPAETLDGLRIGIPDEVWDRRGSRRACGRLREGDRDGSRRSEREVGECDLPLSFDYGMPCYYLIAPAEASSNLARYDGVRYGPSRRRRRRTARWSSETRDAGFGDEPKRRIMLGTYALSAGYYDAYYGQAQRVRTLLIREHRDALERFDVIATPTSPTVAFPIGDKASDPLAMYACDVMTIPSCLAGLPGLSIPSGLSDGLPVGLQLIGRQFGENTLFRAGHALERALGFDGVPSGCDERAWETVESSL